MIDLNVLSSTTEFLFEGVNNGNPLIPIISWTMLGIFLLAFRYSIKGTSEQEKRWVGLDFTSKAIYGAITGGLIFVLAVEVGWVFLLMQQMIINNTEDLMAEMITLAFIGTIYFVIVNWNSKKREFKSSIKLFWIRTTELIILIPIIIAFSLFGTLSISPSREWWTFLIAFGLIAGAGWIRYQFYKSENRILKTNKLPYFIQFWRFLLLKLVILWK